MSTVEKSKKKTKPNVSVNRSSLELGTPPEGYEYRLVRWRDPRTGGYDIGNLSYYELNGYEPVPASAMPHLPNFNLEENSRYANAITRGDLVLMQVPVENTEELRRQEQAMADAQMAGVTEQYESKGTPRYSTTTATVTRETETRKFQED